MPAPARLAVTDALTAAAERFPDIPPDLLVVEGLAPRDRALAIALYRTAMQRWLTAEHLINRVASRPVMKMQPALQAVLIGGAVQLVFIDGLPAYAVINDAVDLAKRRVDPKAGGLVNAVLRKVAAMPAGRAEQPWNPDATAVPDGRGGILRLSGPLLPVRSDAVPHLAAATSYPPPLVHRWIETLGLSAAAALCEAGTRMPTTFTWDERGHCSVWDGNAGELAAWVKGHPLRRVQDPASAKPVQSTAAMQPRRVLDLCAGRGTKTRQLRALHPQAHLTAWDPDEDRRRDLAEVAAGLFELSEAFSADVSGGGPGEPPGSVEVAEPSGAYDLILLDVPCSNLGVLARRPEARYRWDDRRLATVTALQRRIIDRAAEHVERGGAGPGSGNGAGPGEAGGADGADGAGRAGGVVLYSTCSIDPEENEQQAEYLAQRVGGNIIHQETILPGGFGREYHDGSYHACVQVPGR